MRYYENANSRSIVYGCETEQHVRSLYKKMARRKHTSFSCKETGFHVSTETPCIGASPDGLISCKCCGLGVLEIKCPWSATQLSISHFAQSPATHLLTANEPQVVFDFSTAIEIPAHDTMESILQQGVTLNVNHNYYAQVQCQMYCTGRSFCDFVTYTQTSQDNVSVLRVLRNDQYPMALISRACMFWRQQIVAEAIMHMRKQCRMCM